ncbi:MAG TPA: ATP-dependent DNA helicase [Candidatus Acidoferrales bacterium]|jgi:DNA helicase-2/ATP-dependent DNA helicase PcrA|nr:ATP-dependent DNA helicase [Candidatus Acidoferrales bacterium]
MAKTLFEMGLPESGGLQLNDAQRRAITHGDGPLLVIAGAGTGKTRVITERIRHLLESDDSLLGENILGLTFTKKAAGEMKARVVKAVGDRGKDVVLATFHSFCETLLKEVDANRVALESVDHWILLRRNLARLKLEKYRRLAEPGQFLSDFIQFFSRCQDELVSSEDYQQFADLLAKELEEEKSALDEDTFKERAEQVALQQEIARAYRASEEILREKRAVALNGLITEAVTLLKNDAARRRQLQERFKHILVDEFQDTNIAQLELLHLLSAERRNIVVVGDNDQAIYRFRGASFGSFKLFLQRFAGWKEGEDSTPYRVALMENYRSTPNILRVATQAIGMNEVSPEFPKKVLQPSKSEGEKIRIVEMETPEDEAAWVADELERLHGAGRRWKDFAVLYRQHAHRDHLVEQLSQRKIPFVISKLSILEHPLVRDVLAYLRLIAKPFDDIACARVLSAPAWYLTAEDLVRLAERARKKRGTALYDTLQSPQSELPFDPSSAAFKSLLEFLTEQRKTMRRRSAREILGDLIEWLEVPQRAGTQDRKYVNQLGQFMKDWEPKSETRSLPEFLEYLDYFEQAGGTLSLEDDAPGDAVQLMTVHGAKGLEFPHVFLLRVNSNAFPARNRSPLFEFPDRLMKEELPEGDFHIQEERRLFYVALTRAEDRLTMTTVHEKRGKVPVFIEDIVMDPSIKRRDVRQIAPKPKPPKPENEKPSETTSGELFPAGEAPSKIFSRIAKWAEEFHPESPEPLKLSSSAVENYKKCPQRYMFSHLWSLKEGPRAMLSFGSVIHTTIKRFLEQLKKDVKLPFDEVQRIYETEWTNAGYEDEYQEAEYKKDGLEQLKVFHAAMLQNLPDILEQEKGFELPLENNVILTGRMDQVNSLGRKDVEIVDYKTGKPKKDADARKDLQLSIYALAAKEIFEWNPVRLVFHYLQNNQRQETARDAKQIAEAEATVQETAADIRAGNFPAKPGFFCRSCAYKPICPAHEESLGGI